jgi:predicted Zn-dependent peptidase
MKMVIKSGAASDPVGKEGLAHFTEHLFSRNGRLPRREMIDYFSCHGGNINTGHTFPNKTEYGFKLPAEQTILKEGLQNFFSMFTGIAVLKEFENQRKVILQEYNVKYQNLKAAEMRFMLQKQFLKGTYYERTMCNLGLPETITAIQEADVLDFWKNHYHPENTILVSAGDISHADLGKMVDDVYLACQPISFNARPKPIIDAIYFPLKNMGKTFTFSALEVHGRENSDNCFAYSSTYNFPYFTKKKVIGMISDMLNILLFDIVRERDQATYHISSSNWLNNGVVNQFYISSNSLKQDYVDKIIGTVEGIIRDAGSATELFERVKLNHTQTLMYLDPTIADIVESISKDVIIEGEIIPLSEEVRRCEDVSFDDIIAGLKYLESNNGAHVLIT